MNPLLEYDIALCPFIMARVCKTLIIQQNLYNFTCIYETLGTLVEKHRQIQNKRNLPSNGFQSLESSDIIL